MPTLHAIVHISSVIPQSLGLLWLARGICLITDLYGDSEWAEIRQQSSVSDSGMIIFNFMCLCFCIDNLQVSDLPASSLLPPALTPSLICPSRLGCQSEKICSAANEGHVTEGDEVRRSDCLGRKSNICLQPFMSVCEYSNVPCLDECHSVMCLSFILVSSGWSQKYMGTGQQFYNVSECRMRML